MARNSSGVMSLISAYNPVVDDTTITVDWANNTLEDIRDELTASLDRDGKADMRAGLKGFAGTANLPGYSWAGDLDTGRYWSGANTMVDVVGAVDLVKYESTGVTLIGKGTGSTLGPILRLHRDSSSPADADFIGALYFDGEDQSGNQTIYASIEAQIDDFSDSTEDGTLLVKTMVGGTLTTLLDISSAGVVFIPNMFLTERASADSSVAGLGQVWIKNTSPNELWFTNDADTHVQLSVGGLTLDSTTPKTSAFTAVVGKWYLVNTTGGSFNITMPNSPTAGVSVFGLQDYAETFAVNPPTLVQAASSENIFRVNENGAISINNFSGAIVMTDATNGWMHRGF